MGKRGPAPKPSKLTAGKAPRANEPQPVRVMPQAPPYLDKYGAEFWKQYTPKLFALGLLTEIDGDAFAQACVNYSIVRTCAEKVKRCKDYFYVQNKLDGSAPKNEQINKRPEVKLLQEAQRDLLRFMQEFGLTPSARSRMEVNAASNFYSEEDKELLGL